MNESSPPRRSACAMRELGLLRVVGRLQSELRDDRFKCQASISQRSASSSRAAAANGNDFAARFSIPRERSMPTARSISLARGASEHHSSPAPEIRARTRPSRCALCARIILLRQRTQQPNDVATLTLPYVADISSKNARCDSLS